VSMREKVWDRTEGMEKRSATHRLPAPMSRIRGFLKISASVTRPLM
jgi:hypothetical protein